MKIFLSFFILLLSFSSLASEICIKTKEDVRSYLTLRSSRIAFKNKGGLINGGVCWWHSRLQRSSAYLIEFRPESGQKPTKEEARQILNSLRDMNKTVVINGYSNFESFTRDYKHEVQKMLEGWQRIDGFLNFQWVRGISGRSSLPAKAMRARMDKIYEAYKKSPTPIWIMLQIKGITAHAMLVPEMEQTKKGYILNVIDSNNPNDEMFITYEDGDTFLEPRGEGYRFVPYLGFQNDFRKIFATIKNHCNNSELITEGVQIVDGDIENY